MPVIPRPQLRGDPQVVTWDLALGDRLGQGSFAAVSFSRVYVPDAALLKSVDDRIMGVATMVRCSWREAGEEVKTKKKPNVSSGALVIITHIAVEFSTLVRKVLFVL